MKNNCTQIVGGVVHMLFVFFPACHPENSGMMRIHAVLITQVFDSGHRAVIWALTTRTDPWRGLTWGSEVGCRSGFHDVFVSHPPYFIHRNGDTVCCRSRMCIFWDVVHHVLFLVLHLLELNIAPSQEGLEDDIIWYSFSSCEILVTWSFVADVAIWYRNWKYYHPLGMIPQQLGAN